MSEQICVSNAHQWRYWSRNIHFRSHLGCHQLIEMRRLLNQHLLRGGLLKLYVLVAPLSAETHIWASAVTTAIERSAKLKCKFFEGENFAKPRNTTIMIFTENKMSILKIDCELSANSILNCIIEHNWNIYFLCLMQRLMKTSVNVR